MSALMEIIIKGVDQASKVADKVTGAFKKSEDAINRGNKAAQTSADAASKSVNQVASNYDKVNSAANKSSGALSNAWNKVKSTASNAINGVNQSVGSIGAIAQKAGSTIGSAITAGFQKAKSAAMSAGQSIKSSLTNAAMAADTLSGAISGAIGAFGLVEIANSMWTGASNKQFNQAYMAMKLGTDQAAKYVGEIQRIVAAVPGDDTYMNSLLSTATARGAAIGDMEKLAWVTSDYIAASRMQGKALLETQMDIKEYILSGNTGQMERDSILKMQLDKLKGAKTVTERINALNVALNAEGYAGISQLDIASLKWDNIKGKIQLAATTIGERLLPYIERGIDFLLEMDAKTGGLSSVFIVLSGAAIAFVAALSMISGPLLLIGGAVTGVFGTLSGIFTTLTISEVAVGEAAAFAGAGISTTAVSATGATGAMSGLWAALGPVGVAIIAITAAIAIGIYIWQNWSKEIIQLKDNLFSGNWAGAASQIGGAFQYVGQGIWNALVSAGQAIWNFITSIPAMIGNASSWFIEMGGKLIDWIITGLTSIADSLSTTLEGLMNDAVTQAGTGGEEGGKSAGEQAGGGLLDGFIKWISDNGPKLAENIQKMFTTILPLVLQIIGQIMVIIAVSLWNWGLKAGGDFINGIIQWIQQLPGQLWTWFLLTVIRIGLWANQMRERARKAGSDFVNNVINFIRNLPGMAWTYLMFMIQRVVAWANQMRERARQAGQNFVNRLRDELTSLPGKMYTWGQNAFKRFSDAIIDSVPGLRWALDQVAALFPHSPPKTGPLATVKAENMKKWASTIGQALNEGVEVGATGTFDFISDKTESSNSSKQSGTDSSTKLIKIEEEWNGTLTIKLEGVPDNIDDNSLKVWLKSVITDSDLVKKLTKDRGFMSSLKIELAKEKGRTQRAGG
jgi:hypothetical protein